MTDPNAIHDLFGSFRAEWLRGDIYKLFSEPAYFAHLLGNKSCVLMGGRGSGKTTVLRCLSYEGQEALGKQDLASPAFVGVYYKINTNVVTAFDGSDLDSVDWTRLFGHYLNLTICGELAKYLAWYRDKFSQSNLADVSFRSVALALGLEDAVDLNQLIDKIMEASTRLELYINNLGGDQPTISQLQSPIANFINQFNRVSGHENTVVYIILDEYENLLDYQQKIVNTLIKHSGDNCYFKIGVRELGWRVRVTLNDIETLISPADYELIHIEDRLEADFSEFAQNVCESRLRNNLALKNRHLSLDKLLPTLTTLQEAERLGVHRRVSKLRSDLEIDFPNDATVSTIHDYKLYVFYKLNAENLDKTRLDIEEYEDRKTRAINRYDNYAHALLFTLADKGLQVSKHYCGHRTFARIANRNIRFYMQLVHESIVQQISIDKDLNEPIDGKDQTLAARLVGLNYLRELEGVTAHGSQLAKLVLGFGRVFSNSCCEPSRRSARV